MIIYEIYENVQNLKLIRTCHLRRTSTRSVSCEANIIINTLKFTQEERSLGVRKLCFKGLLTTSIKELFPPLSAKPLSLIFIDRFIIGMIVVASSVNLPLSY